MTRRFKPLWLMAALSTPLSSHVLAQPAAPKSTFQEEWVYRVKYGYQDEFWRIFQKYQIPELDEEERRGYVIHYAVFRPGLHTSEESRWDYRIIITYRDRDAATHESEVTRALFPDSATREREENRRWEITTNHWDLPIHEIDPHAIGD